MRWRLGVGQQGVVGKDHPLIPETLDHLTHLEHLIPNGGEIWWNGFPQGLEFLSQPDEVKLDGFILCGENVKALNHILELSRMFLHEFGQICGLKTAVSLELGDSIIPRGGGVHRPPTW